MSKVTYSQVSFLVICSITGHFFLVNLLQAQQ